MMRSIQKLMCRHSHTNWALADQAMVSSVNFATGILLARFLGLEEFGRFSVAWMVVLLLAGIQHAAIVAPMMSIGPKQEENAVQAYYGAVVAQLFFSVAVAFGLILVGSEVCALAFPEWRFESIALPLACTASAYMLQDFTRRYFFTRQHGRKAFISDLISYPGQVIILIGFFQITAGTVDSNDALWIIAATSAGGALYGIAVAEAMTWKRTTVLSTAVRHWQFSRWLVGATAMQWATGHLFMLAAGALLGAASVGALRAAQNLMGVTHVLFFALENIVPVRAARHLHHGGRAALARYLWRICRLVGFATAAVALLFGAIPEWWLGLFYGDSYAGFGYVVRWFAAIYLLTALALPLRAGLRALERTRPIFLANVWTTVFSLALSYPLVRFLDLSGGLIGIFGMQALLVITLFVALNGYLSNEHGIRRSD